jgi:hypothetical protein
MKGSQLVSIFLSSEMLPMIGTKSHSWVSLEERCPHCTALTRQWVGIFCANFRKPMLGLPLCHHAWCAPCYRQRPGTDFLVYTGSDVTLAPSPNEESNYMQACEGDSLFCPFEYDKCYFIVSLVPRAFVQMIIIIDYSITSDVLIWTHSGPVQRIQYKNSEECFLKRSN